jgi:hypothetical protein
MWFQSIFSHLVTQTCASINQHRLNVDTIWLVLQDDTMQKINANCCKHEPIVYDLTLSQW